MALKLSQIQKSPESYAGAIEVCGWVRTVREGKNLGFVELTDGTCFTPVQIVFERDDRNLGNGLSTGCAIAVSGELVMTPDAPQPFDQTVDIILPVAVVVDSFDDFGKGDRLFLEGDVEIGGIPEVFDEASVEAVEDGELLFVDFPAQPGSAPKHLHPEDAGLHHPHENDHFYGGDIHAGGQHVHGDHYFGLGAVAELADFLQGAVDGGASGDFHHEVVALAEDFLAGAHHFVGVDGAIGPAVDFYVNASLRVLAELR